MNSSNIDPRNSIHGSPLRGTYLLIAGLLVGFGLFIGQFLDHDMTFDQRSRLGFPTQPIISQNARTPIFDLDSVYAGGPGGNPELYDPADPIKFRIESGGQFEDLPRDPINHVAIIGDPRNDE